MFSINVQSIKDGIDSPLLVLVDPQMEYLHPNRPLGLEDPLPAVHNCQRLLAHARKNRIPVAFLRWVQPSRLFNPSGIYAGWIDGLGPSGSDMVFERAWPSAYSSKEFTQTLDQGWGRNIVLAGFTGTIACLATIVEGSQKQHRYTFISDASQSHAIHGQSEKETHAMARKIISLYARTQTTAAWIEHCTTIDNERYALSGV
jgi:nicotinamidase-related amidase